MLKCDFSDKINRRLLLKGALVTGPESSHDCDKHKKKLILEEKNLFYILILELLKLHVHV